MAVIPHRDQIDLAEVLSAFGAPVRLAIVQRLADGQEHRCGSLVTGVSKSTLTHHWKALLAAGIIHQRAAGRENLLSLRRDDLDARFPGLLNTVLDGSKDNERVAGFIAQDV